MCAIVTIVYIIGIGVDEYVCLGCLYLLCYAFKCVCVCVYV